jgi:hypothetical protein
VPAATVVDQGKLRCARLDGLSLRAKVAVPAHARKGLERVCRYLLRLALAGTRGQLLYELAYARADGPTHLLLDSLEPLERLSVLMPAPRLHLLRYHGMLRASALVPRRTEECAQNVPVRSAF